MIDTVGVKFPNITIPNNIYSRWNGGQNWKGNFLVKWSGLTINLQNGAPIQYTYYPFIKNGLLKVEFSLPHVIYGTNTQMINKINDAINIANSILPAISGIPKVDLWAGILYRLDTCYNFQVGGLLPWYINLLLALEYPRRNTRPYTSQGVQFQNNQVILKFYDKARARKDKGDLLSAKVAQDILRLEIELKKAYIENLLNCKYPTLRSITAPWLIYVIENELNQLNLLGNSIGTVETTFSVLQEKYGSLEAFALIGMLKTKLTYLSIELFADHANRHPKSINRQLQKKFKQNGLPLTFSEHFQPLPPLNIDRDYFLNQA